MRTSANIEIVRMYNQSVNDPYYMIWVKEDDGRMIESLPYSDDNLVDVLGRFDANITTDDRPMVLIDEDSWEYHDELQDIYMHGWLGIEGDVVYDYDGCFELPQEVIDRLVDCGYDVSQIVTED